MNIDQRDHIMRPFMSIMRPIRLPRDLILRIILYLIPPHALRWIRHDFHYSRHVRTPMLHEMIFCRKLDTEPLGSLGTLRVVGLVVVCVVVCM